MSTTLALAKQLISMPSVTPEDAGCQALLGKCLEALGFRLEPMRFGGVDNLWARLGAESPVFCFAGHTDVVPSGPLGDWASDPFVPTERGGKLYGRGAADMKGSLAAMVTACERYLKATPAPKGSIAFLLTSDEEGAAQDGTKKVVEALGSRGEKIDYCLVGEASTEKVLGDVMKNGRRGSTTCRLKIRGKQGHVAYPHLAENPIHGAAPFLADLSVAHWDDGNDFFPPTSMQVVEVQAGTGTNNVIPGEVSIMFNFRFSTESTPESLRKRVEELLSKHDLSGKSSAEWSVSGHPFLTESGKLIDVMKAAVQEVSGIEARLSTGGGTSDGRFIAPTGAEVVELGPNNASIHKVDECIDIDELERLSAVYEKVLEKIFAS